MRATLKRRQRMQPVERHSAAERRFDRIRKEAYLLGLDHGLWFGQCDAILRPLLAEVPAIRSLHVLFVATGKGYPYSPLDYAISTTLRGLVARLTVTDASKSVAEMAINMRPDIVIVLDGLLLNVSQIDTIRKNGIRTAIWFTDDPYYTDFTLELAPHYDDVFTLELTCVEFYRSRGCMNVHYLPLGVFPEHFRPINPNLSKRHDICFIGSAYLNRVAFFNEITPYLVMKDAHISGIWWERLKDYHLLEGKIDAGRWMTPLETAEMYNGSKIVINMHRAHDDETFNNNSARIQAVSPNPRTFEISACATLQLTDIRHDLASFYTPGVDIITYSSPQEMIEKMEYYTAHEEERKAIAIRGMARTMREHTYAKRLEQMLSTLFPN